jgi:hypothetical protein
MAQNSQFHTEMFTFGNQILVAKVCELCIKSAGHTFRHHTVIQCSNSYLCDSNLLLLRVLIFIVLKWALFLTFITRYLVAERASCEN